MVADFLRVPLVQSGPLVSIPLVVVVMVMVVVVGVCWCFFLEVCLRQLFVLGFFVSSSAHAVRSCSHPRARSRVPAFRPQPMAAPKKSQKVEKK